MRGIAFAALTISFAVVCGLSVHDTRSNAATPSRRLATKNHRKVWNGAPLYPFRFYTVYMIHMTLIRSSPTFSRTARTLLLTSVSHALKLRRIRQFRVHKIERGRVLSRSRYELRITCSAALINLFDFPPELKKGIALAVLNWTQNSVKSIANYSTDFNGEIGVLQYISVSLAAENPDRICSEVNRRISKWRRRKDCTSLGGICYWYSRTKRCKPSGPCQQYSTKYGCNKVQKRKTHMFLAK